MGPLLTALLPVAGNILSNLIGGGAQSAHNMRLARYQNAYNDPASQMQRYRDAGLNPNLVYSQGNPGNMSPITPTNWQGALSNVGTQYTQSELTQTQSDVGQQKINESKTKQILMEAQRDVLRSNPLLDKSYLSAMVNQMVATAKLKSQEAEFMTSEQASTGATTQGQAKMTLEINALAKRNGLLTADDNIKAEILKSQKFNNELKQLQVNWMKNAELTPQHILNGIMLLLQKFMSAK